MPKYSNWKFRPGQPVTSLFLDELNPRLPSAGRDLSQSEAILDLIENEDVYELAKHIAAHSFFPNSDILVMPRSGVGRKKHWTVLEGNRRIAALKILPNPDLAPEKDRKKFRLLSTNLNLDEVKKVNFWEVPDRASAEVYLATKHSPPERGLMTEWTPMQKAAFYGKHADGQTLEEVAGRFSTTVANVAEHVRMFHLYEMARRIDLTGKAQEYWLPRQFPVSVLERIIAMPDARKMLKIKLQNDGNIGVDTTEAAFLEVYKKILTAIAEKKLNTRDNIDEIKKKLPELIGDTKIPKGIKTTTSSEIIGNKRPIEGTEPESFEVDKPLPPAKKPTPVRRFGNGLFTDRLISELKDNRIPEILVELQKVDAKHCNATAMLLRTTLELALIGWLKKKSQWSILLSKAKNKTIGPMMSDMIKHVIDANSFSSPLDPQEMKALRGLFDKGDMDTMNGWVHNPHYPSDPISVQAICSRINPLLNRLLSGK